jgi:hypothetical protein
MIIYSNEPEKLKTIIGELFLHKDQILLSEETKNWLNKVQVEPIDRKTKVIKTIVGYLENSKLKRIIQGFKDGYFLNTRSPDQAALDIVIWKSKDNVYVDDESYTKVALTIESDHEL